MCLSCPVPAYAPTPTFPRDQPHPASPDLPPESRASLSSLSPRVRSRTDCQLVLLSSRYGAWTHISPDSPRCPCVCAAENELLLPSIQAGASSPPYRSESSHAHNGSSQRAHPPLLSGSAPYARASLHVTRPKASAHPPPSPPPQVLPRNEYVSPRPAIATRLLSLPSRFSPPPHPPRPVRTTPSSTLLHHLHLSQQTTAGALARDTTRASIARPQPCSSSLTSAAAERVG